MKLIADKSGPVCYGWYRIDFGCLAYDCHHSSCWSIMSGSDVANWFRIPLEVLSYEARNIDEQKERVDKLIAYLASYGIDSVAPSLSDLTRQLNAASRKLRNLIRKLEQE